MFAGIRSLLADWFALEPSASLTMIATAILLFGVTVNHLRRQARSDSGLMIPLVQGLIQGILFIGIVGAFYFLLAKGYNAFKPLAESLVQDQALQKQMVDAAKYWGSPFFQGNLAVTQTFSHEEVVEVLGPDSSTFYINETIVEKVDQESITRFEGQIDVHVADKDLATYTLDARYEYDVVNQTDKETVAQFEFPLEMGRIFRNLVITVDGRELGSNKRIQAGKIQWEQNMLPNQKVVVAISFTTRGMKSLAFYMPEKRPIQNFLLTVDVDTFDVYSFTQPDSTAILVSNKPVEHGYQTSWAIKNSILAPYVGIILDSRISGDKNQEMTSDLVQYMPRGLMLMLIIVVFTLLLSSIPVDLWKLALLAAIFSGNFLALMGLDLIWINQPFILPMLALPTIVLVRTIYRRLQRLPLILIVSSSSLFLLGYPYAGLLPDGPARIAFDSLVQALVILYIFVLAFYMRVRRNKAEQPVTP